MCVYKYIYIYICMCVYVYILFIYKLYLWWCFYHLFFYYFLTSFISSQYLACSVFILNLPVWYAVSMSRLHCEYVRIYIHVYINVTVHAILYYVLSYRYFYYTFVLLSQQWLNKDAQSSIDIWCEASMVRSSGIYFLSIEGLSSKPILVFSQMLLILSL